MLLDSVESTSTSKKDAFKNCSNKFESMVVLVFIATTYTNAIQSLSGLVFKIC